MDALGKPNQKSYHATLGRPGPSGHGRRKGRDRGPVPALSFLAGTELGSACERLAALERDLRLIQPTLPILPLKLARQVLVVTAGSPTVAARLRQFEPSLIQGLRARGWLVGRIRFRPIAIHDVPAPPPARVKEPVSTAVVERIAALQDEEMAPELRAALAAFVRRQRGYRGS